MLGKLRNIRRLDKMRQLKSELTNPDVSIFASNCVGGIISHDLGLRFNSPTVNLFMLPSDFIRMASRPEDYLDGDLIQIEGEAGYPLGRIDDITIHFVHYSSFEEASTAWRRRCLRVDLSNCCWILVDRDGCNFECARAFDSIPYERKVLLSYRDLVDVNCCLHNKEWVDKSGLQTRDLCAYKHQGLFTSPARFIDDFDYVRFLNDGTLQLAQGKKS